MRLTPPRRAKRRMAGFVMPWMLSRKTLRWRLAPPLPNPLPPLPRPDMLNIENKGGFNDRCGIIGLENDWSKLRSAAVVNIDRKTDLATIQATYDCMCQLYL
uniref:Uncharacterized protein n=1 Tax=Romanomermis culicivorax TaxID=13658 RepID=A0A915IVS8_ROMCU